MAGQWNLPFRGNDLDDNDRIWWGRKEHGSSGIQMYGYDLGMMRYQAEAKQWSAIKEGTDGTSNSDYFVYGTPVYAMEDGKVIAGWRNAPENPKPSTTHSEITDHPGDTTKIYGGGNGMWVEHADGSRVEYAHFKPGSVPAELVPHDDELFPETAASTNVADCWKFIKIEPADQKDVKKGQLIGRVGNAGTSSAPHLHIHRQKGAVAVPIEFVSGLSMVPDGKESELTIPSDDGWHGKWSSFAGQAIPAGPVLIWPSRARSGESVRHGMSAEDFALFYEHFADSGLWPEWLDFYSVNDSVFVNHIWRPATEAWRCYWGLNETDFAKVIKSNKTEKFEAVIAEPVTFGGPATYAAVFVKGLDASLVRHGLTYDEHMGVKAEASGLGLAPVSVAVVDVDGKREYTVLYRKNACANWNIKSRVAEDEYHALFEEQDELGRRPSFVSAYILKGKPYLSVVFATPKSHKRRDRHGLSADEFQDLHDQSFTEGKSSRVVTAFNGAKAEHRYAASWWE